MMFRPIRGTHDLFGLEIEKYNIVNSEISKIAKIYNFKEIETPIFESTNLFSKPLGVQSDVVLKEMYTFLDRNNDSLTLRPEYTTPMIRAAISNNLLNSLPCKVFGIGPMFRRERPQKGRYRQFNQINFENFGSNDPFADVELILIAKQFIETVLPKNNCKLHINSLGDKETLKIYKKELSNYLRKFEKDLSNESKEKILINNQNYGELHDELSARGAPLVISSINHIINKKPLIVQENKSTYAHKINKSETQIDWRMETNCILNLIRAFSPYPGAYTHLEGKRVRILKALRAEFFLENLEPGDISIHNKCIYVGTKNSVIQVKELQLEGKKTMNDLSFINGYLRNSEKTYKFEKR